MGLIGKKLSRKDSALLLDDMLARVGLSDYAATPIGELSGGQLQRALFGRALITNPEVLILDLVCRPALRADDDRPFTGGQSHGHDSIGYP